MFKNMNFNLDTRIYTFSRLVRLLTRLEPFDSTTPTRVLDRVLQNKTKQNSLHSTRLHGSETISKILIFLFFMFKCSGAAPQSFIVCIFI